MILKLGYTDIDGINTFRYIENFTDLRITSFKKELHKYYLDSDAVIYGDKHEIKNTEILFNPEILKKNEVDFMHVTYVYFLNKENRYESLACLSDSVFLMNDAGKTIDKY
jgi:hypothetical protein